MKKHLIIASYDGISTHYCGVGTTIQDTISSLKNLVKGKEVKISLAYIAADPQGVAYDKKSFENSAKLVRMTGGHLIPLCNGTAGFNEYDMWQSFPQWEYACASLASALHTVLKDEEDNVLMLNDAPFLLFHKYQQQIFGKKLRCFYIPRSSGLNHKFGNAEWRTRRVDLEREAFRAIQSDPNASVLAIGKNFARHLTTEYGLSFADGDYLMNGLYFPNFANRLDRAVGTIALKKFGINLDPASKIIFSWGRASVAKGLRELMEAWREVADRLPDHFLLLQAPNNSGEDDYFQQLKQCEKEIPRTMVLNDFNPEIWQTVLRTRNTSVVCIPSLMDPNPHTPIEAKLFSVGMNYVMIGSSADGVKDTFTDDECLWVDPRDTRNFANQLFKAARMGEKERQHMSEQNQNRLHAYNYSITIRDFLKRIQYL